MTDRDSPDEAAATAKHLLAATRRALTASAGPDFLAALAADLFARTPPEDLALYSATEIAAFVQSAADLLAVRAPGRHLIRTENPMIEGLDERHRDVTVISTLTDNMPFLLDSLIG